MNTKNISAFIVVSVIVICMLSGSIGIIINIRKLVLMSDLKKKQEPKLGIITNIISLPRSSDKLIYFKFVEGEREFKVRVFKLFARMKRGDKASIVANDKKDIFFFEEHEDVFYWNIYLDMFYFSSCYFFSFCFYRVLLYLKKKKR
jgi:hypothetical protein